VNTRRPGAQVDDDTFVALEHPGGETSHLSMSVTLPLEGRRFVVNGTRGGFGSKDLDPQEAQLAKGMRPGDAGYGQGRDGLLWEGEGGESITLHPGAYQRFYEAVPAWLRGEAPAPVDPRDSVAVLRVLDAARQSAATNSVIELEDSQ
jgi:predicted dehydrogenase